MIKKMLLAKKGLVTEAIPASRFTQCVLTVMHIDRTIQNVTQRHMLSHNFIFTITKVP
jgi:hypothetical protein